MTAIFAAVMVLLLWSGLAAGGLLFFTCRTARKVEAALPPMEGVRDFV
jgi:hypothetical protein